MPLSSLEVRKNHSRPRTGGSSLHAPLWIGAGLFLLIQTFSLLSPILLSLLLILLLSFALNPVVARLRALTGGRKPATVLLAISMLVLMACVGIASLGPMISSMDRITEALPEYWARFRQPLLRFEKETRLSEQRIRTEESAKDGIILSPGATGDTPTPEPMPPRPAVLPSQSVPAFAGVGEILKEALSHFSAVAFNAAQMMVVLVTVFFGVMFTLMNPGPVWMSLFAWVPEQHHAKALAVAKRIAAFVPGWASSTLVGMISIGMLVTVLLWPILGFTDALVLGLIAGLLEAVPFIGPLLSAVPGLLLAAGKGGLTPVWVALVYVGVQMLENHVILPFVMARGMKLHPVAVMIAMLLCVAAFGVLGVLVAAPLVAFTLICYDELYRVHFLPSTTNLQLKQLAERAVQDNLAGKH